MSDIKTKEQAFQYICEQTEYDETSHTGLRWKFRKQGRKPFSPAGYKDKDGYYIIYVNKIRVVVHRVVYFKHFGNIDNNLYIDHIDGNRDNNRVGNLRLVTNAINSRNSSFSPNNTSGVTGVSYDVYGNRWTAFWRVPGTTKTFRKHFPVQKYGEDAFDIACNYRESQIHILNDAGAGYSARHGKNNGR